MSELPRLHTEPESELERSLLNAGRGYTASTSSRAKALAAVGLVGVTASSTAAASAVTKAGIAKWLVAVALVAGVAVPVAHYLRHSAADPASAPVSAASPPVVDTQTAAAIQNSRPVPTVDTSTPATEPAPNSGPNAARVAPKPAAPALSAELGALDAARSALAAGDANGALTQLDAYARNFPHGKLSLEAEVLRIDALAKSGQTAAARKRAEAFMKRHPDSVLASRVRAYAEQ
ncbi:MAG TPA: outer membrane protein assembly factor BamD [Polyangiaceae bacterium]|jgi:hypothetical protein|nr:outer membrane protein assembly factor BamD [Polyangiaceae bacterium]